jgi:peroxiredoxin (alkyl hydroperoxide reductase subunit C)
MKTKFAILITFLFSINQLWSQENKETRIPLLGEFAPQFTAESTKGKITFPDDYVMKWKILFSHPSDFTPVCSSEIIELALMQEDFEKLGTQLVVVSTDGLESHVEWIKSLEAVKYKGKTTHKINFPLVADNNLVVSKMYGMIHSYTGVTRDVRGVFIIDPNDRIQAIFFYPSNVGRNIEEIKRTLIALQTTEKENVLTPVNWKPGEDYLLHAPKTKADAENLSQKHDPQLYSLDWYLWFQKAKSQVTTQ